MSLLVGLVKKDHLWFKKSYYRIELLLLEERNDKKISGPAEFLSGTEKNPAFTRPGIWDQGFPRLC